MENHKQIPQEVEKQNKPVWMVINVTTCIACFLSIAFSQCFLSTAWCCTTSATSTIA